jgi:hypothetical protein
MEIPVEVVGNKILLPNYFKYPYQYRMRDYDLDYELVVPKNKKVILINDDISFSDDTDDEDSNVTKDSLQTTKQTNSIVISSDDSDSITINGKKYHEKEAEKILENKFPKNIKQLEKLKDIKIKIKDGKDNISIETK